MFRVIFIICEVFVLICCVGVENLYVIFVGFIGMFFLLKLGNLFCKEIGIRVVGRCLCYI